MTCGEAKELIASSWQKELPEASAPDFHRHLQTCAECGAEMAVLSSLWERLADMPVPEPSLAMHARWHAALAAMVHDRNDARPSPWRSFKLVWFAAAAVACILIGVLVGANLPQRNNDEVARLHQEIASTREMVALALLQQQSATERLRGVEYTDSLQTMQPEVISALVQAVSHDANVNVRLAAIDALSKVATHPGVSQSLTDALPRQDSPMVQAALIDYLIDTHDHAAIGALQKLAMRTDLNPAVLERTHFALRQLTQ